MAYSKLRSKKSAITALCFLLLIWTIALWPAMVKGAPNAVKGELDLTNWNWDQDGAAALDGEWEFYWQRLLTPEDFRKGTKRAEASLITVPRAWNKHLVNGNGLSGDGFATYRLLVHISTPQMLGIKLPRIFTAYNLWVNGRLVASSGKVATDTRDMIPQYLPKVKYIKPETETLEFVIQIANFRHRSGGILESIQIGSEAEISHLRTNDLALQLFLFGSLFVIGFYHFGLFIFRTKDRSTLYFGIYAVLIAIRTLLVGEIFFIYLFPNFSWEIAHKIQTLAYYLGVPLIFSFLKSIFPNEVSAKAFRFIQTFGLAFSLLVLFTPAKIFTQINPIYQLFTLIVIPYALFILLLASRRKREGAYLIGLGVGVLTLFTINDIVFLSIILSDSDAHFLRSFVKQGNLSSWGLLIFTFTQSLVLAKKLSKSFTKVESMTTELQHLNENLEQKVEQRTQDLETSNAELELAYQAVSNSEKSRRHLVQNISHDLRTPLTSIQGYVEAILDGTVGEPNQQNKYLGRVLDKVNSLTHMVQQLAELSQLESRQLKLDLQLVPVPVLINDVIEKYRFDVQNAGLVFDVKGLATSDESPSADELNIMADLEQLDRVFSNLFSNAAVHTPDGGTVELSFNLTSDQTRLLIGISDTGIGIPKEAISHIFERFYQVAKARHNSQHSSGLGLAITKEIVEYHGGKIWVDSEPERGSHFFFTLPLNNQN